VLDGNPVPFPQKGQSPSPILRVEVENFEIGNGITELSQRACVLVFLPVVDILNIPCDCQFVLSVPDELLFHTMLDAGSNILRVRYKSMSINQSINLFRYTLKAYSSQNHNSKNIHIMCNG